MYRLSERARGRTYPINGLLSLAVAPRSLEVCDTYRSKRMREAGESKRYELFERSLCMYQGLAGAL